MIVAEISQNFTNLTEATKLVRLAKENGADLVKAQLFDGEKTYGRKVPAELSLGDARDLFDYGKEIDIEVFFSVFDVERVKWCEEIGVKRYKIAYSQKENDVLKKIVGRTGKPIIISCDDTGVIFPTNWHVVSFLYCIPEYPTINVRFEAGLFEDHGGGTLGSSDDRREYHKEYHGFSDHTFGIDLAKIALARGADIIEKHFAIDHQTGVDAEWSMTPSELKELKRWETVCKEAL